jgi:hypothetical protein
MKDTTRANTEKIQRTTTIQQQKKKLNMIFNNPAIFTSLHFTATYFTLFSFVFLMLSTPLSLSLIYHVPNPFSKTIWFAGESPLSIFR